MIVIEGINYLHCVEKIWNSMSLIKQNTNKQSTKGLTPVILPDE